MWEFATEAQSTNVQAGIRIPKGKNKKVKGKHDNKLERLNGNENKTKMTNGNAMSQ